ncbi:MAG: hypothetical protein KJ592_04795 [Nanoarchaeota archaeon]|nr:hypothetical protein [Nanoarchaeota archaeon]
MKNKVMDVIAWIFIIVGISIMLSWYFLKAFGIVNSPIWFEILPALSAGISVGGFGFYLGSLKKTVDINSKNINKLSVGMNKFYERLCEVERMQKLCVSGKLKGSPYEEK